MMSLYQCYACTCDIVHLIYKIEITILQEHYIMHTIHSICECVIVYYMLKHFKYKASLPQWSVFSVHEYEQALVAHRALSYWFELYFLLFRCHFRIKSATTAGN